MLYHLKFPLYKILFIQNSYRNTITEWRIECHNWSWRPKGKSLKSSGIHGVLVLAGIELVFFAVACMVLCFGFEIKIVVITVMVLLLLSSPYKAKAFLFLTLSHQRGGWERTRSWWGVDSQGTEGMSVMAFVFRKKHHACSALLSWKWLNICLPMGSNSLFCYACTHSICFTYWLLIFPYSSDSLPHPTASELSERLCRA